MKLPEDKYSTTFSSVVKKILFRERKKKFFGHPVCIYVKPYSLASEAKKFAIAETLEELKYARIGKTIYLYRSFGRKVGCYITHHIVRFLKKKEII